ncbi:MAG TPA: hypothetical protein VFC19_42190 [Candidatus Limnocylindrales bacterium]|nr:hypothetical protein [Candidatus Limnocylindrales bacterium]
MSAAVRAAVAVAAAIWLAADWLAADLSDAVLLAAVLAAAVLLVLVLLALVLLATVLLAAVLLTGVVVLIVPGVLELVVFFAGAAGAFAAVDFLAGTGEPAGTDASVARPGSASTTSNVSALTRSCDGISTCA